MQRILFCLLIAISCLSLRAQSSLQNQVAGARFQITKKTVEFLSTDKATFPDVKENTCAGCKTFDDLKQFSAKNNITRAGNKVIDPLSNTTVDVANWKASLQSFAAKAENLIMPPGKENRKQLSGYDDYKSAVEDIINGIQLAADNNQSASSEEPAQEDANARQASVTDSVPSENNNSPVFAASSGWLSWLPYGIAAILLGWLIFVLIRKRAMVQEINEGEQKIKEIKAEAIKKNQAISSLQKENERLEKELANSELDRKALADLNFQLENERAVIKNQSAQPAAASKKPEPAPMSSNPAPKQPAKKIKYARYADTGDGFSDAELLDNPDNETIFELTISPNYKSAEFSIADNAAAQHYALSNTQYFLGKTCQYDSFPSENAAIKTDVPGKLELNASKWKIVNPAKISFT